MAIIVLGVLIAMWIGDLRQTYLDRKVDHAYLQLKETEGR
jgi:hypothetical protein